MKKILLISLFALLVTGFFIAQPVFAEDNGETEDDPILVQSLLEQIQALMLQLQELQEQVRALHQEQEEVREEIREAVRMARQLEEGMTGEDIELLQEILATDPEIYPEGLITGFFGPLTKHAVMKFQKKFGIEQVGRVGPQTLSRINQLLKEGAGDSGKVPPGLLLAPGIQKKLDPDWEFTPPGLGGTPPGMNQKGQQDDDENGDEVNGDEEENGDTENGDEEDEE